MTDPRLLMNPRSPLSLNLVRSSLVVTVLFVVAACCSGEDGDQVTEAACDVIMAAGCELPASQNDCFEQYIVRNQDCCGQEYMALMNCYAGAPWRCEGDSAVTDACAAELSELNGCEGDHPLCPHPPTGRPKECN